MESTLNIEALIRGLARHRVRYVLFGTLGAIAYEADLATRDMDICPATDVANLRDLADLLTAWDAKPRYVPGHTDEADCEAWTPEPLSADRLDHDFAMPYGALDIVPAPYGPHGDADRFTYDRLDARATTVAVFGCSVRVAHVDDLIASKMSRRRPKDLRAEGELLRVRERVLRGQWRPGLVRYAAAQLCERGGE
jgi:hypothetical protein